MSADLINESPTSPDFTRDVGAILLIVGFFYVTDQVLVSKAALQAARLGPFRRALFSTLESGWQRKLNWCTRIFFWKPGELPSAFRSLSLTGSSSANRW